MERRLLRAASDDDIVLVQALIAGGGISGKTLEQAFACAADHNAWKAMGYLIKEGGVEVNTCCDATGTALHHAILSSAAEALQVLTDAGSCPSIVNERGLQPWAMFAEAEEALTRPNANDDRRPMLREMMEVRAMFHIVTRSRNHKTHPVQPAAERFYVWRIFLQL